MEKLALIVVDMTRDNVFSEEHLKMSKAAQAIIPNLQRLLGYARQEGMMVIFANDSFFREDLMFAERIKPHSLRGTEGCRVISELQPRSGEITLEKRNMSAFFRTDLDLTLRVGDVDTIVVAGISTPFCVLLTALDGFANGFRSVIIEDCCAAYKPEVHNNIVEIYGRSALYPIVSFQTLKEFTGDGVQ